MTDHPRPVIYVHSTLSHAEAARLFPGAVLRGSIRRGDLYRDRALGYSVFLIIDGVFLQQQAVSPREVLDVIGDGALVAGASSMGALRAAECWPGGMRGVGSIYRLFRNGALESDDEVVVMFSPLDGSAVSLALVNVRYAVNRLARRSPLTRAEGQLLVSAAQGLFFADRTWANVFAAAGLEHRRDRLQPLLDAYDLKKVDAQRAIARLRGWLERPQALGLKPGSGISAMLPSELRREPSLELPPAQVLHEQALAWLIVSGRYRQFLEDPEGEHGLEWLHRAVCLRESGCTGPLLQRLEQLDELTRCCLQFDALESAGQWALQAGVSPGPDELAEAGQQLAHRHGFAHWHQLQQAAIDSCCRGQLERAMTREATTAQVRERWFQTT